MKKNVISFMATLMFASSVAVSCGNKKTSATESVQTTVAERNVFSLNIGDEFIPAGYMGCIGSIEMNPAFAVNPRSGSSCYKIAAFQRDCNEKWAGVYWTNRDGSTGANWGEYAGTDLSNKGFTKITFWARGNDGGEAVEFGSGGIDNTNNSQGSFRYKDSYNKTYSTEGKTVILTREWQPYTIDLAGKDLSSVIGGFFWAANQRANPTGLIFYLDDILFE